MTIEAANILVVEDDPAMCVLVGHLLKRLGVRYVHFAKDGTEALKLLATFTPNVILTDIHMQPMGGLDFIKVLRTIPKSVHHELPVVFMSADNTLATFERARHFGAIGYLLKPPQIHALKEKIEHAMDLSRDAGQ